MQSICWCALSIIVSLFVARLPVFILIQRCFKEKGSCQEKNQTVKMLVLGPLHEQSVSAHWYAVYRHTISALPSYTHPTSWLRFRGSGSLLESKWWEYVMVEADSHLKLLSTSILDIYKVFEHISHSYTHPTWLRFLGSGSLVESNDVIMSWLRLTATSNCFSHPY